MWVTISAVLAALLILAICDIVKLQRKLKSMVVSPSASTNSTMPKCSCGGTLIDHRNGKAHCFECRKEYRITSA